MARTKTCEPQPATRKEPYGWWALALVAFPALLIFVAVFGTERRWGFWLGNELGFTFLCYLIGLGIVAVIRKVIDDPMIRIPTYWFWFGAFFALICLTPCLDGHIHYKGFRFGGVILADAYSFPRHSPWATALPIHTIVATVSATIAAMFQHFRERRRGSKLQTTCKTFGIGTLLLATTLLAATFGLLSWIGAPAILFGCILVAAGGQFITVIAVGLLDKKPPAEKDQSP